MLPALKPSSLLLKQCQAYRYSTLPKKASGKFTSNKLIPKKDIINEVQRTLVYLGMNFVLVYVCVYINCINRLSYSVYIGPFSETMKRYKMTASFFGVCGMIIVPGLVSTGQVPLLSVALGNLI